MKKSDIEDWQRPLTKKYSVDDPILHPIAMLASMGAEESSLHRIILILGVCRNLYLKHLYNDPVQNAELIAQLRDENIAKLTQIASLFYDSAADASCVAGSKECNLQSAENCYHFLTKILNVDGETAARCAEAVGNTCYDAEYAKVLRGGNPDLQIRRQYRILEVDGETLRWRHAEAPNPKPLFHKLLEAANRLSNPNYTASPLNTKSFDFYDDFISNLILSLRKFELGFRCNGQNTQLIKRI
jgi:hypothetical protein